MVLDTPSPLIVVPSRLIDPFVCVRTVRLTYYTGHLAFAACALPVAADFTCTSGQIFQTGQMSCRATDYRKTDRERERERERDSG